MLQIAVIGAGVIGMSSAIQIAEKYGQSVKVTVITEKLSPDTTSDVSAGLWGPYYTGTTPGDRITKWSKGMHDFQLKLWKEGHAAEAGITMIPVFRFTTNPGGYEDHPWKNVIFGYTKMNEQQLESYRKEHGRKYTDGFFAVTFTSEPVKLLPYLYKRFKETGGKILMKKVNKFDELANFDVIVNCTGLGSLELAQDKNMHPIRGQIIRVSAPWTYGVYVDDSDDGNYIIPNCESVVLGGTHQMNNFNLNVCPNDKEFIRTGCERISPGLKTANFLFDKVGLRPGRTEIRMERNIFITKSKKRIPIIHCVGHGGCGVTLSWGCGSEVLENFDAIYKGFILKSNL